VDHATLSAAVRYFPLLGRPRPACPSLSERVNEIVQITGAATQQGTNGMNEAAHALNKAALLASDCGLADLSCALCWQHINVYSAASRTLTPLEARYMLEPVLNLARLRIRADVGAPALQLLHAMYQAVTKNTDLVVDGRTLPLSHLHGTPQEDRKLREWVWIQYLGDGIRALTLAGRWDQAVAHAGAHRGIGLHLMDGRQATIITHCLNGATATARAILKESTPTQPWEQQVASCLNVMCADANRTSARSNVTTMIGQFFGQQPIPGYAVFRARLGLAVATLASHTHPAAAKRVLAQVAAEVVEAGDGYAARDVLRCPSPTLPTELTDKQRAALTSLLVSSGLGSGTLPEPLHHLLTTSMQLAKATLAA
jgi:hypothetical protein